MKKFAIAAVIALTAVLGLSVAGIGAGQAAAKYSQNVPRLGRIGDFVYTFGSNANCRGSVHVAMKKDPRKPGWMQVTVRSNGFTGDGAAWRRSPLCKTGLVFTWYDARPGFYHEKYFAVKGTRSRGTLLGQKAIFIGQGVNLVSMRSTNPLSYPAVWYTLMN